MRRIKRSALRDSRCAEFVETPVGGVIIEADGGKVTSIRFGKKSAGMQSPKSPAARQITDYFKGKKVQFRFSKALLGTDFQRQVWRAIDRIPRGQTKTYGEIAHQIGRPKAYRAVGQAANRNPWVVTTPCHRVIGHNARLDGLCWRNTAKRVAFAPRIPLETTLDIS